MQTSDDLDYDEYLLDQEPNHEPQAYPNPESDYLMEEIKREQLTLYRSLRNEGYTEYQSRLWAGLCDPYKD